MTFNGSTVLIVPVPQRTKTRQVIQAGNMLPKKPAQAEAMAEPHSDPWLNNDPWQDYYRSQQQSAAAPAPAPVPRSIAPDAPIAGKFHAQDDRLTKLEQAVVDLKQNQQEQAKRAEEDKASLQCNLQSLSSQFTASLEAMQAAQVRQQEQLFAGMTELKTLFQNVAHNEPSKKHKHGRQPDMETDDQMPH